jgi:hypothetical protein
VLIDAWPNHSASEINGSSAGAPQVAKKIMKADGSIFDGCASQSDTTLLQVRVEFVNAQVLQALRVCALPK